MIDFPTKAERRTEAQRLLGGLSPQWVADRFGNSKATVRLWKRGERTPKLEDLLRLVVATGRPLSHDLQRRIFGTTQEARPGEPERADLMRPEGAISDAQEVVGAVVEGLLPLPAAGTPPHPEEDGPAAAEPRDRQR